MTRCTRWMLILCCLQLTQARAADPAPESEPAPAAAAAEKPVATPAAPRTRNSPAAERFEPSEQISEDLSVSFPADI